MVNVLLKPVAHVTLGYPIHKLDLPLGDLLGESEISQSQVAILVQKKVLRFQVSVHHMEIVQVLESQNDLGGVESGSMTIETAGAAKVRKQFATRYVIEKHVKEFRIVVGPVPETSRRHSDKELGAKMNSQFDDEWMIDAKQDVLLGVNMLDLATSDHFTDAHHFQSVIAARVTMLYQNDASECSCACKGYSKSMGCFQEVSRALQLLAPPGSLFFEAKK